ncbi:protein-export chaperone SecB [Desemzia incerta]|uniref:protein-export chaperone SecB n=1 Tax=Desemzia incerta TaxID=82801 RepID=UPI0016617D2E|nr:protein-export chaperone SecB [Desemzia incerta]
MTNNKPVIELEVYRITNVDFTVYDTIEELKELNLSSGEISASIAVDAESENARLQLSTVVIDEDNLRTIKVELTGYFVINEKTEAKKHLSINGTAILFPYLRSFVSILSSLDNSDAIILPTINTHGFVEAENPQDGE